MTFVERPKFEAGSDGGRINVTLASEIWECEEHGLWRIYISGRRERVTRTQPEKGKTNPLAKQPMNASEVTRGKEAQLACGCIGTRSSDPDDRPVFWINRGCGDGGEDHQPGFRRILEPDDEVRVLGNYDSDL